MRIADYDRYSHHMYRKKQGEKTVYALFTAVFASIFWGMYFLFPFIDTFDGKLWRKYEQGGVLYDEPTGYGALVFLWYVPIAIGVFFSVMYNVYHLLILKAIKKEQALSWLETFAGFLRHNKSEYNRFMLNTSVLFTSLLLPLLSFIPNDLSNGIRILLLYFITFLTLSTYGLRYSLMQRTWEKAHEKEAKKQKKEQAKQEAKKQKEVEKQKREKEKEQTAPPTLSQLEELINRLLNEKEYQLPHFKQEVGSIIQEIRYFAMHGFKANVEDLHMIERILKEEVPAVLATYDELDEESKQEYHQELKDCLEKIQVQLAARNKGRQNMKKLGAQKVIEIIQTRY